MRAMFRQALWRDERGSSVAQAAAVAMVAALVIAALLSGASGLTPAVDRAFTCLVSLIGGGGGGGCSSGAAPASTQQATTPPQQEEKKDDDKGWGWNVVSIGLDFIPGVGEVKGLIEVFTGEDLVTGEDLGNWRWAGLAGLVGLNEIKYLRYGDDVVEAGSGLIRHGDDVVDAGSDAGRHADDIPLPCPIGSVPRGKMPGLAKPVAGRCNLAADGKFVDDPLEEAYQDYLARKQKAGETPRSREDWLERREFYSNLERGNEFNRTRADDYPYNEVNLESGKRLDSYNPATGEIVSRKATDFDAIQESTFRSYLTELQTKYPAGSTIRSNKYPDIDGTQLSGKQILEVPESNLTSASRARFEQIAREMGIEIRYAPE